MRSLLIAALTTFLLVGCEGGGVECEARDLDGNCCADENDDGVCDKNERGERGNKKSERYYVEFRHHCVDNDGDPHGDCRVVGRSSASCSAARDDYVRQKSEGDPCDVCPTDNVARGGMTVSIEKLDVDGSCP